MAFLRSFSFILALLLCAALSYAQSDVASTNSNVKAINIKFTTLDVPGAGYTNISAINTVGQMVGSYGQNTSSDAHGFLYANGVFTYFDYPGQMFTLPMGINDSGLIVGHAGQSPVIGFLYDGTSFTTLQNGNDTATFSDGINNSGIVVGGAGTIYATEGFRMRNGQYQTLNFPGQYTYAAANGVSNLSVIVGWTSSPNHGYLYRGSRFQSIDFPGAGETTALGINDNGVVVGWYGNPAGCSACAFAWRNGKYLSFSYPGAVATSATGINLSGQIVGQYTLDYQTWHGFVTNPITTETFGQPEQD